MSKRMKWLNNNKYVSEPALIYDLVVPHAPRAQSRPRAAVIRGAGCLRATMYKPRENMVTEEEIRRYWEDLIEQLPPEESLRFPWNGPVKMVVRYVFQPPKSNYWDGREKDGKPDLDNLQKMFQDALNKYAWADDSQIIGKHTEKCFGAKEGTYATLEFYEKAEKPARRRKGMCTDTTARREKKARRKAKDVELLQIIEGKG